MGAAILCLALAGVLTAVAWAAFDVPSEEAMARRRLWRFPRVRLSEARPGNARVTGRVIAVGDPLRAPLTGRPCAYHEVSLRVAPRWAQEAIKRDNFQYAPFGSASSPASITVKIRAGRPFEIDDGTGRALAVFPQPRVRVGGRPPEMDIYSSIPATHNAYGFQAKIPPDLLRLAAEAGALAEPPAAIEGDEGIIGEGDVITVAGQMTDEVRADGPADSYRAARVRLVITGEPLILVKTDKEAPSVTSTGRPASGPAPRR